MNEIISKRTERNKTYDLGGKKYRLVCHCKPIHYIDSKRDWKDIELDFQDDRKGNWIADKNKVSVGFRKDKKFYKYFGLRYDEAHQFEGTLKEITLDGIKKVQGDTVSSLQRKSKTEIVHQLNSGIEIVNQINEVSLKTFVKPNNPIEHFKIVEELHLKGLTCSNKKEGSKYVPDEHNRFNFIDENKELKFWINQPFLKDNTGEHFQNIEHTLQDVGGHLLYTKVPTIEGQDDLLLAQYPILIDTNTYYSSTADGYVNNNGADFTTVREAGTGVNVYPNDDYTNYDLGRCSYYSKGGHNISRSFFYFDTSDLPDEATVTVATLKVYGKSNDNYDVCAQKGIQAATLTTADYDSFVGTTGDNDPDGREYGHITWVIDQYNSISFNQTGKDDVNKTGTTKVCVREYTHDYLNSAPTEDLYNGGYYAEQSGTDKDPKLEIDYTENGDDYRRRIIINGFMKIKTAIIIGGLITSFAIGALIDSIRPCEYYVWHEGKKQCVSEQLKEYIENVEVGNVDRLKSKRGVKINQ
ncbi:MAG: hypothetical protein ACTSQE_06855 [Candidatus Heimdallarchaeaceae archaeon]